MWINLAAEFARRKREIQQQLADANLASPVEKRHIAHLPEPVQQYLYRCGVVGRPPIRGFQTVYDAVMFQKPGGRALPGPSEQIDIVQPPRRLFFMASRMFGVPVAVLHDYAGIDASMRVRIASLVDVTNQTSQELARTETVTLLNDLCFFAPSALASESLALRAGDDKHVEVSFTNGPHVVKATLAFGVDGDLVNFLSEDRSAVQPDHSLKRLRWSTPMREYRDFDGRRIPTVGEAIWHYPQRDFVYGRFAVTCYRAY
jgi:hypothetical protein